MKKTRKRNLIGSVLIMVIFYFFAFMFLRDDAIASKKSLLILSFIVCQVFSLPFCIMMITLRLMGVMKNRYMWIYQYSGTLQVFLFLTDSFLIVLEHSITRNSLLIFICLNAILGTIIFADIYKTVHE